MTTVGQPQGLCVINALNLPYLRTEGEYHVNTSPPYYSSYVCYIGGGSSIHLPLVTAFPGIIIMVKWPGYGFAKLYQAESGDPLIHIGGSSGNTDHLGLTAGMSVILLDDGTYWQLINSFHSPSLPS